MNLLKNKTKDLEKDITLISKHNKELQEEVLRLAKERDELKSSLVPENNRLLQENVNLNSVIDDYRKQFDTIVQENNLYKNMIVFDVTQYYFNWICANKDDRNQLQEEINKKLNKGYTINSIICSSYGNSNYSLIHVILNYPKVIREETKIDTYVRALV